MCMYVGIKILNISVCKKNVYTGCRTIHSNISPNFYDSLPSSYKSCLVVTLDVSFCQNDFTGGKYLLSYPLVVASAECSGIPESSLYTFSLHSTATYGYTQ